MEQPLSLAAGGDVMLVPPVALVPPPAPALPPLPPVLVAASGAGESTGSEPKHAIPTAFALHQGGAFRHVPASSAHGAP
jgi:hypothetical protein